MKISGKLATLLLVFSFVPFLLIIFASFRVGVKTLEQVVGKNLRQKAVEAMDKVDRNLYERANNVRAWSKQQVMQEMVVDDMDGRISSFLTRMKEDYKVYLAILCLNMEGQVIASSDPALTGKNLREELWFEKSRKAGKDKIFVGDMALHPFLNTHSVVFSIPIQADFDETVSIGVLAAFLDWNSVMEIMDEVGVIGRRQTPEGYVKMINKEGLTITIPSFADQTHALLDENLVADGLLSAARAVRAEQGYGIEALSDSEEYLIGFAPSRGYRDFKGPGWSALVFMKTGTAFYEVYKFRNLLLVTAVIFFTAVLAFSMFAAKRFALPLQGMVSILKDIAHGQGDLTRRVEVRSRDEIGELAGWFNQFIGNVREMVVNIKTATRQALDASGSILTDSSKLNKNAVEQSKFIEKAAGSIENMNALNQDVAVNTKSLADSMSEASAAITEIGTAVGQVTKSTDVSAEAVQKVAAAVQEMGTSIEQVTRNIHSLSRSMAEINASMTESESTIREIEQNAKESSQISEEAMERSQTGKSMVNKTIANMEAIRAHAEGSSKIIEKLGKRSKEIGKIIDVVKNIADQTNLLSLNAAIVSAQAGEHGREFAVVAEEIRALAEQTVVSTREITQLILAIQKESMEAIRSMDESSENVRQGVSLSTETGGVFEGVLQSVQVSRDMTAHIARSTVEQANMIRSLARPIENVTRMVQEILHAAEEQGKGSEQIVGSVDDLDNVIAQVKKAIGEQNMGIKHIMEMIEETDRKSHAISDATARQKADSESVVESIEKTLTITRGTTRKVENMDDLLGAMSSQMKGLWEEVSKFKTE